MDDAFKREVKATERDEKGRWVIPPKSPGRPKGARSQLGEDFLKALHDDFETHGVEAIQQCRTEKPVEYVKVIASILPKELNVKIDPLEEMTDDELIERIHQLRSAVDAALGRTGEGGGAIKAQGGNAEAVLLPPLH